ncbi:MAG TPA: sigma-70 family RNA polymerase sigma factor [Kiloniellales bacterium]|nr:sigma-70 family RNA polymerase sigma factor [Kiloniellales bacterium]
MAYETNQVYRNIERHIPHLRRYARYLARDSVAADDLVQESLTRALAKADLFKRDTNLRAWLFTILRNEHISHMRRQGRRGTTVDPEILSHTAASQPEQPGHMALRSLRQNWSHLPKEQRILIDMVGLQGRSYEEAADATNLPVGTVKSRISRGRTQLRRLLDGETPDAENRASG